MHYSLSSAKEISICFFNEVLFKKNVTNSFGEKIVRKIIACFVSLTFPLEQHFSVGLVKQLRNLHCLQKTFFASLALRLTSGLLSLSSWFVTRVSVYKQIGLFSENFIVYNTLVCSIDLYVQLLSNLLLGACELNGALGALI